MSLSNTISYCSRWAGGAIVPMFAKPISPVGLAWFLHVVLVLGVAVGLYFVQQHFGVTVDIQYGPTWLRKIWLAALFLLIYALLWSAAWLWDLLKPNQIETQFPDIDQAWADICNSLAKAGIGLGDTPMYLVFGDWNCGYEPIFRMLPNGLAVCGGTSAGSPIQAFANRDGIYIALPGASLIGYRGQMTEYAGSDPAVNSQSIYQSIGATGKSIGLGGSIAASIAGSIGGTPGPLQEIQRIIKQARDEHRPLSEAEKKRVRELSDSAGGGGGGGEVVLEKSKKGPSGASVLQNPAIANELAARLFHVCGLVAAARWPLCPINGAIIAVPMSAVTSVEAASQWGLVAREDLLIADFALKLRFPVYALVGGLEDLPGAKAFFAKFAFEKSSQRLGKGFPLNPDLTTEGRVNAIETSAKWVFGSLLPYWIVRLMRADTTDDARVNSQMVRFLAEVRHKSEAMALLLSRALATEMERPPLFGGCYITVVLPDAPGEAKFAREFFHKVEQTQGYVQWTPDALTEDAKYRSMAKLGTLAALAVIAGVVVFGAYVGITKWSK